jgi:hypothetical protein
MTLATLAPSAVDLDDRERRLTIARALVNRLADQLERLSLADEQQAVVDEALRLALIVREELEALT